jgi:hypothetical protein
MLSLFIKCTFEAKQTFSVGHADQMFYLAVVTGKHNSDWTERKLKPAGQYSSMFCRSIILPSARHLFRQLAGTQASGLQEAPFREKIGPKRYSYRLVYQEKNQTVKTIRLVTCNLCQTIPFPVRAMEAAAPDIPPFFWHTIKGYTVVVRRLEKEGKKCTSFEKALRSLSAVFSWGWASTSFSFPIS